MWYWYRSSAVPVAACETPGASVSDEPAQQILTAECKPYWPLSGPAESSHLNKLAARWTGLSVVLGAAVTSQDHFISAWETRGSDIQRPLSTNLAITHRSYDPLPLCSRFCSYEISRIQPNEYSLLSVVTAMEPPLGASPKQQLELPNQTEILYLFKFAGFGLETPAGSSSKSNARNKFGSQNLCILSR